MAGFVWKRDRVSEVVKQYKNLEKAFQSAGRKLGPSCQNEPMRSLLAEWRHHLIGLGGSIQRLRRSELWISGPRRTSTPST